MKRSSPRVVISFRHSPSCCDTVFPGIGSATSRPSFLGPSPAPPLACCISGGDNHHNEKEVLREKRAKRGGVAALYLAAAYALGITLFLVVLDAPHIVEPAQKVALLVDKSMLIYLTNLLLYVIFGIVLVVLTLALHERLQAASSAIIRMATAIGLIWAGMLIASGMVASAGNVAITVHKTTS